jgi:hypothetical protein
MAVVGNTSWRFRFTANMKEAELHTADAWVTRKHNGPETKSGSEGLMRWGLREDL